MKRVSTFTEIILFTFVAILGLYMLSDGTSSGSANATATLIGGAVFSTLSAVGLVSAVKSIFWHRRMSRHLMDDHGQRNSVPEHKHG